MIFEEEDTVKENMALPPDSTVDVHPDGDVVLILSGMANVQKPIGIRVSSHVLSMTSPVFRSLFSNEDHDGEPAIKVMSGAKFLPLPFDDGNAMHLLCNILHLRNNALPTRLPVELLRKLAALVDKYHCANAAGRATTVWFDQLHRSKTCGSNDVFQLIEAAYLLDEPTYFARFTERWVLGESMASRLPPLNSARDLLTGKLIIDLYNRRQTLIATMRADLDLIVDPCSLAFSSSTDHWIDYVPGMSPEVDDSTGKIAGSPCHVDEQAAQTYLGALRDAKIWPATTWPATLEGIIRALREFKIPVYDDCDRCEFCEGVKDKFTMVVVVVKQMHAERLWGLCLDCFKSGNVFAGECRYEHTKARAVEGLI